METVIIQHENSLTIKLPYSYQTIGRPVLNGYIILHAQIEEDGSTDVWEHHQDHLGSNSFQSYIQNLPANYIDDDYCWRSQARQAASEANDILAETGFWQKAAEITEQYEADQRLTKMLIGFSDPKGLTEEYF